jgi:methionine-S-sulfoxide reductase
MRVLSVFCSIFLLVSCSRAGDQPAKPVNKEVSGQPLNSSAMSNTEVATLGGGCYWCLEAIFQRLDGVLKVESGFSGGQLKNPSYREVCSGLTGHAEVIQVSFDTAKVSFAEILKVFFEMHDPTTLNRQGADVGTQYRSAIFYHSDAQKQTATEIMQALTAEKVYDDPIVTEVAPFKEFYKAEAYHQNYFNENGSQPYCRFVIQPKVEKFEKVFKDRLKK